MSSATTSFLRWSLDSSAAMRLEVRGLLFRALEGGSTVLEELLLPIVEERGPQVLLIAEIRDGHPVDQMPS